MAEHENQQQRIEQVNVLPDGSSFFVAEIDTSPDREIPPAIRWNPWNKVVQDCRDGTIHHDLTNVARADRGLPVPWVPAFGNTEPHQPPVW